MTVRSARAITYTLVGLFSVVAIRLTPPVNRTPDKAVLGAFAESDPQQTDEATPVTVATAPAYSPAVAQPNELMTSPVIVVPVVPPSAAGLK